MVMLDEETAHNRVGRGNMVSSLPPRSCAPTSLLPKRPLTPSRHTFPTPPRLPCHGKWLPYLSRHVVEGGREEEEEEEEQEHGVTKDLVNFLERRIY